MNRQFIALGALLLSAAIARADLIVTQKVEGVGQAGEIVVRIKGDKVRADLPRDVSSISDAATGEMVTLMHAQKSYLRIPPERTKEMMEGMQKAAGLKPDGEAPKLQPTNRKEKVGEWDTEVFTWKLGELNVTYWIAKTFPNHERILESMSKMQGGVNGALGASPKDFPGMPVKVEMSLNGKKITTTTSSVKEEPVDAAIFEMPKDYKEIELPATPAAK